MNEDVNAHTLTLLFHRFLNEREWREVAEVMLTVPYVVELRMNAVVESPEQLFTDGWNPLEHRKKREETDEETR